MAFCYRLDSSGPFANATTLNLSTCRFPCFSVRAFGSSHEDGANSLKPHGKNNVPNGASSDVMKLFNEVQQNMLFLNKQRVDALDDLRKAEMEKETLLAKIKLLETKIETVSLDRDTLKKQLQMLKLRSAKDSGGHLLPSPIFSELLLRLDSMVLTGAINRGQASQLKSLILKQDVGVANTFSSLRQKSDRDVASGLLPLLNPNRRFGLHITHICAELNPAAISGAVGSFVVNLSSALQKKGNLVDVVLPKYATMDMDAVQDLRVTEANFQSFFGGQWHANKIWTGLVRSIPVTFIESLHPDGFFLRDKLYDYKDDFERFSYFCRAALEYILKSGKQPDVLHLHDWQTALVAPMFWELYASQVCLQGLGGSRILLTCSSFRSQCLQEPEKLGYCGLDPMRLHRHDRLQDAGQPNMVNILKGGIVYSNKITTMAPLSNAFDLENGQALQATIMAHKNKLLEIMNGVDLALWDPATDVNLPSVYSIDNLSGKLACKRHIKKQLGLLNSSDSEPLQVGCLMPQASESNFDLIKALLRCSSVKRAEFVLMGGSKMERFANELEGENARIIRSYDDSTAHLIIAASDILVCLSSEGTTELPLIAMMYGSVPVAKHDMSVSLKDASDSVHEVDANAFIYSSGTAQDLSAALLRAIDCNRNDPEKWKQLIRNGMSRDFSWDGECVQEYISAYASLKQL
ncbi:hypothetical protein KP509_34G052700 [Ceratopteris richardii]|uniref:starch synthase n=1 Tax=Ceratopteris richardii TaxID=49495 RepID=A0A8T2QM86_CERRI|nr:hypothetical protein KP509_34G052700 [Ceratopteris richardii]